MPSWTDAKMEAPGSEAAGGVPPDVAGINIIPLLSSREYSKSKWLRHATGIVNFAARYHDS